MRTKTYYFDFVVQYVRYMAESPEDLADSVQNRPTKYIDTLQEDSLACYWEPSGHWYQAHGERKASGLRGFLTENNHSYAGLPCRDQVTRCVRDG